MANDNNIGGGTIMVAFVMGALAGAAVALLFAPASGEETRDYIGEKAREGRAKAREALQEGRNFYQQQRENVAGAVERGREAFQEARERGGQQA